MRQAHRQYTRRKEKGANEYDKDGGRKNAAGEMHKDSRIEQDAGGDYEPLHR
jgi:hypothetical protein